MTLLTVPIPAPHFARRVAVHTDTVYDAIVVRNPATVPKRLQAGRQSQGRRVGFARSRRAQGSFLTCPGMMLMPDIIACSCRPFTCSRRDTQSTLSTRRCSRSQRCCQRRAPGTLGRTQATAAPARSKRRPAAYARALDRVSAAWTMYSTRARTGCHSAARGLPQRPRLPCLSPHTRHMPLLAHSHHSEQHATLDKGSTNQSDTQTWRDRCRAQRRR